MPDLRVRSAFCRLVLLLALVPFLALLPVAQGQSLPSGYDVVLLIGQSNMVGFGTGPDNAADAAVDPRIFMWDGVSQILPAQDPLVQDNGSLVFVGLGMTFAKAYEKTIPANRNVLLVGSAQGLTSFISGRWQAPNGDLTQTALSRANAAMAAAGPGARFAGILWHQGESDVTDGGGPTYEANLQGLVSYLRSNITGASATTPFVVGEFTYDAINGNINSSLGPPLATVLGDFHTLPDTVNNAAWVSSVNEPSDATNGYAHFSALSQRQFGRRYADKLFEAANGLPQPQVSMKSWGGSFVDDGRGLLSSTAPVNALGTITGTVAITTDAGRGNVAQISAGAGTITYTVPETLFNGSYTKVSWFKQGAQGYGNNLISSTNPSGSNAGVTFLNATTTFFGPIYSGGHSDAKGHMYTVSKTVLGNSSKWTQLALTYNAVAQTLTLYLNGAKAASVSGVPPAAALSGTTMPLVFGGFGTLAGRNGVDGLMGGNRVWTTALTAAQISAIYNYELNYRAGF